jgi:transcriptional regulator with XRE-family HTH domain
MKILAQFIADEPKRPLEMWAKEFGISRSYLSEILSGKSPGRATIEKIDRATAGKVPAASWFESFNEAGAA